MKPWGVTYAVRLAYEPDLRRWWKFRFSVVRIGTFTFHRKGTPS